MSIKDAIKAATDDSVRLFGTYWASKDGKRHRIMFPEDAEDAVTKALQSCGYGISYSYDTYPSASKAGPNERTA